jgi:hypothetical protein
MCRLCRLLFLLGIVTVAVGFFRGWFTISTSGDEHTTSVNTTINKEIVRDDLNKAVDKFNDLRQHVEGELEHD